MTHPHVRRPLASAAVLTLSVVLTACGGSQTETTGAPTAPGTSTSPTTSASSGPPSPSSVPTRATPSTKPAPTRTPSARATAVSAEQLATLVDTALDDSSAAHLVVENGLGFLSGEGDIDFRDTPSSLAMTLTSNETGDGQAIVVSIIGTTMYLQDADGFLKVDIDSPSNPFGSSLSDQLDPRTVLDVVQRELTSAASRGQTERDGETLEVYRALADGPAVVQQLAPDLEGQEGVVVPASVTCELTVDADGHARGITVDLGPENGQLVYTLTDWRTDVSIEAPPASQVSDLPDLG